MVNLTGIPGLAVSPFSPFSPRAPLGPSLPCFPGIPPCPGGPLGPGCPSGPAGPGRPTTPWSPGGPVAPFAPAGPCAPFNSGIKMYIQSAMWALKRGFSVLPVHQDLHALPVVHHSQAFPSLRADPLVLDYQPLQSAPGYLGILNDPEDLDFPGIIRQCLEYYRQ